MVIRLVPVTPITPLCQFWRVSSMMGRHGPQAPDSPVKTVLHSQVVPLTNSTPALHWTTAWHWRFTRVAWTCTVQMESHSLSPGLMTPQTTGPTFSSSTRWSQCRPPTVRGQTEGIWVDWAFKWMLWHIYCHGLAWVVMNGNVHQSFKTSLHPFHRCAC